MSDTNPCLAAALAYAGNKQRPLYIFPSSPGDAKKGAEKKSRVSGRHTADGKNWGMTNNADTINSYWAKWPDSNVCIVTGEINGLFVLETDTDAHGKDGEAELKRLITENENDWPNTRIARSPSGSLHYYFTWPTGDVIILNSDNKIAPGVDVRGDGGMVVAPPSFNPKYDARYEWINNVGIAAAPKWLIELLASKPVIKKVGDAQAPTDKLDAAMQLIPNHDGVIWDVQDWKSKEVKQRTGWDGWNDIAMALYRATAGSDEGFRIFDKWCQRNVAKYDARYTHYSWYRRYRTSPPRGIGAGTLFMLADEHAPGWRGIWEEEHPEETKAQKDEYKDKKRAEEEVKTEAKIAKGDFEVKVYADQIYKAVDQTEKCMLTNETPFYRYGGKLVRVTKLKVNAMKKKKTIVANFVDVDLPFLTDSINRYIDFKKYDKKENDWKSIDPPPAIPVRLLSRTSELGFADVKGMITTPTMRDDGSLLLKPGFDEYTGLLLIEPPPIPDIPDKPTMQQAKAALDLFLGLLDEFPFSDDVARAVALSAFLTPVARGAFDIAPMHVNRAPVMSSGKSYLFDCVAMMVIGQDMPATAAGKDEEETQKSLGASLISGQTLINIDNVNGTLGGAALCQYTERTIVNVRVLGKSENKKIEARSTTFFATGNNISLVGDMVRRAITCTLDPRMEKPDERSFTKNPKEMIANDRGKYIAAALTICKAYMAAGSPNLAKPEMSSYHEWSGVVRSALVWLGQADVQRSIEIARDEDQGIITHRGLLTEWDTVIGRGFVNRISLSAITEEAMMSGTNGGFAEFDFKWPDLNAAVMRVASVYNKPADMQRFGSWMRLHKERVLDGLRFKQEPNAKGQSKWWIENVNNPDETTSGLRSGDNIIKPNFGDRH